MKLKHEKQQVLDLILTRKDPQNYRIKKVLNQEWINPKRLLLEMEREGLIKIEYVTEESGRVRRNLTQIGKIDHEYVERERFYRNKQNQKTKYNNKIK